MLINLISVLFLVVTLVVGTKVTNDRSMSLNISEKASDCFNECRQDSGRERCNERCGVNVNWKGENVIDTSKVDKDADPKAPTCDANGVQYSAGAVVMYGGIGSNATCGSDGKWDVGVGATIDIKPENVPEYAKGSDKLKKQIEVEEAIVEAEKQAVIEQITEPIVNNLEAEEVEQIQKVIEQEQKTQAVIQTQPTEQPLQIRIQQKEQQAAEQQTTSTKTTSPFAQPTTSITVNQQGSVSIKQPAGSVCTFSSDCESGGCGIGGERGGVTKTCQTSPVNQSANITAGVSGGTIPNASKPYVPPLLSTIPTAEDILKTLPGLEKLNINDIKNFNYPSVQEQEENKKTLLGNLASLSTQFSNALNRSELEGLGTYGLGGGNAYIAPVPMNIINSEKSSDFYNYAIGNTVSVGAGVASATLLTPGAPMFVFETATSIPGALRLLTAADIADNIVTGGACALGNQESCSYFQSTLFIPAPTGVGNMLVDSIEDFSTSWAGTGSTINKLINKIPSPALFNPSSSFDSFIPTNTTTDLINAISPTQTDMLFAPALDNLPNTPARVIMDDLQRPLPDVEISNPVTTIQDLWKQNIYDPNVGLFPNWKKVGNNPTTDRITVIRPENPAEFKPVVSQPTVGEAESAVSKLESNGGYDALKPLPPGGSEGKISFGLEAEVAKIEIDGQYYSVKLGQESSYVQQTLFGQQTLIDKGITNFAPVTKVETSNGTYLVQRWVDGKDVFLDKQNITTQLRDAGVIIDDIRNNAIITDNGPVIIDFGNLYPANNNRVANVGSEPTVLDISNLPNANQYHLLNKAIPNDLKPLEDHLAKAASLIKTGKYDEAINLMMDEDLTRKFGVSIEFGKSVYLSENLKTNEISESNFIKISDFIASAAKHELGSITAPSVSWHSLQDNTPIPNIVKREEAITFLEEWIHELQFKHQESIGIPYSKLHKDTNHEDEVVLYLNNVLKIKLSEPYINRPFYDRERLGLRAYSPEEIMDEVSKIPATSLLDTGVNENMSKATEITIPQKITNWWDNIINPKVNTTSGLIPIKGTIEISKLHPHEFGYNPRTVDELTSVLEKSRALDPVKITEYNGQFYTYDGANRVTAYVQSGQDQVPYIFTEFDSLSNLDRLVVETASTGSYRIYKIPERYGTDFPISPVQSTHDTDFVTESWFQRNIYSPTDGALPTVTNWAKAEMAKTNPNAFLNGPVGDFLFGKPTVENAGVSIINYLDNNKIIIGNSSNNGNGKILIVDLNNDPDLRKLIDNSNEYLANVAKDEGLTTSEGLTNFVNDQFPEYNTSKITETVDNVLKQELQLYTDNPEGIVIGQFIKLKCAVCREQSTMLHVLMATNDIDSKIVLINLGSQNHAYVEFIDDVGREMIADPVLGFVLPKNEAFTRYSGTTNKQTEILGEIIVTRPQTPVNTRVATNKNLTITTSTSPLTGFAKFQNDFTNWVKDEMAKTNPNALDNINEDFSNFWQKNVYSPSDGFLPKWTDVNDNPIINRIIGSPEDINLRPNEVANPLPTVDNAPTTPLTTKVGDWWDNIINPKFDTTSPTTQKIIKDLEAVSASDNAIKGDASIDVYLKEYGNPEYVFKSKSDATKVYNFQRDILRIKSANDFQKIFNKAISDLKKNGVEVIVYDRLYDFIDKVGNGHLDGTLGTSEPILFSNGKKSSKVSIASPELLKQIYKINGDDISLDTAKMITLQKIGHEGGHSLDWIKGLMNGDLWLTEIRQKNFNLQFYEHIGSESEARHYQDFLEAFRKRYGGP